MKSYAPCLVVCIIGVLGAIYAAAGLATAPKTPDAPPLPLKQERGMTTTAVIPVAWSVKVTPAEEAVASRGPG